MATINTEFIGITNLNQSLLMSEIENTLKMFFDWSFLKIGGWTDVTRTDAENYYGGDSDVLRYVQDDNYTDGQVWQGHRKDWCWETGVNYTGALNPTVIGNPYVGGVENTAGHTIDYPNGKLIFTTAVSTSAVVTLSYSYRTVQTYVADSAPWFQELQWRSLRSDDVQFTQSSQTGDWSTPNHQRIQLPAVVIECVSRRRQTGHELGNNAFDVYQDVVFHVLAENRTDRNNILDAIAMQDESTIWLLNSDEIAADETFPLGINGNLLDSTKTYPALVAVTDYQYKKLTFRNMILSEINTFTPNLHEGIARCSCHVIAGTVN